MTKKSVLDGFTVRTSTGPGLRIELVKERWVDADRVTPRHRSTAALPSLAAMCASTLRRARSRSLGDTFSRLVSKHARTAASRSFGL